MSGEEYVRADGSNPFRALFDRLDSQAAAKVATAVMRLATGNTSNVKWFGGIGECWIDLGPGYRIYLAQDGAQLIVLFGGGTKRRQQADVARAKELHAEYRARKTATRRGASPKTKR
jgi:putative addiction module killer protein